MPRATGTFQIPKTCHPSSPLAFHTWQSGISVQPKLKYRSRIYVHASDTADRQALVPGSKVSFIYETDEKGGKAREVDIEEMGEHALLDEGPRETGTVIVRLTVSPHLNLRLTQTLT